MITKSFGNYFRTTLYRISLILLFNKSFKLFVKYKSSRFIVYELGKNTFDFINKTKCSK